MQKSKATAALLRLKEIDKKYRLKQAEEKQTRFDVSSESSLHSPPAPSSLASPSSKNVIGSKEVQPVWRPKLEIQMPETRIQYTDDEFPTKNKTSSGVFITLYKKSSKNARHSQSDYSSSTTVQSERSKGRLSSLNSKGSSDQLSPEVTSARSEKNTNDSEKRSINDTFTDDAILTESENTNTISVISQSGYTHTNRSSEMSGNKNSIIRDKVKGEIIVTEEVIKSIASDSEDLKETQNSSHNRKLSTNPINMKSGMKNILLNIDNSEDKVYSETSNDIKDEHQSAKEFSENYSNDSFEEGSTTTIITIQDEQNRIDTLSVDSEKSVSDYTEGQAMLGVKKVDIVPRKDYIASQNSSIDDSKKLIEIVTPKVMEKTSEYEVDLDKDLSEYVKSITSDEILSPVSLLKSPKHDIVNKRRRRKSRSHTETLRDSLTDSKSRKDSINNSKKSVDDSMVSKGGHEETISDRKTSSKSSRATINSLTSDVRKKRKHSSKSVTTNDNVEGSSLNSTPRSNTSRSKSRNVDNELINKLSNGNEESFESDRTVQNTISANNTFSEMEGQISQKKRYGEVKGNVVREKEGDGRKKGSNDVADNTQQKYDNQVFLDDLSLRNSEEVSPAKEDRADETRVLRKLHRDAIEAMNKRDETQKQKFSSTRSSQGVTKKQSAEARSGQSAPFTRISTDREIRHFHEDLKAVINDGAARVRDRKKVGKKTKRPQKSHSFSRSEDECLRLDKKQIQRLRRQMDALRLQEERESLRSFFDRLETTRSEMTSVNRNFIKPLHFPKIEEFTRPDSADTALKSIDSYGLLYERILAIKQRLKDQLILYHNYSNMARKINEAYVPTTLEDVRKTIREHRQKTCETR